MPGQNIDWEKGAVKVSIGGRATFSIDDLEWRIRRDPDYDYEPDEFITDEDLEREAENWLSEDLDLYADFEAYTLRNHDEGSMI